MAITRVQTTGLFVTGTAPNANPSLTFTVTVVGVAQGDTLLVPFEHANFDSNGTSISVVDNKAGTVTIDNQLNRASTYTLATVRVTGCAAGDHTLTFTANNGTAANSFWRSVGVEYSGGALVLDKTGAAQNPSSTGPMTVTSAAPLTSTADLVFAVALSEGAKGGWTNASGYTQVYKDATIGVSELNPAGVTTAQTANFGSQSTAGGWDAIINTYYVAGTNFTLSVSELAVPIAYNPIVLLDNQPQNYLLLVNTGVVPVTMAPAFADYLMSLSELSVPIAYKTVNLVYTPVGTGPKPKQPLIIGIGIFT